MEYTRWVSCLLGLSLLPSMASAQPGWARFAVDGKGRAQLIEKGARPWRGIADGQDVMEVTYPRYIVEEEAIGPDRIVEVHGRSMADVEATLAARNVAPNLEVAGPDAADELIPLLETGPSANRIDLVFMGDGYTAAERELFIQDAKRIFAEMFETPTFRGYRPLFNIWAVFRPSVESGIGKGSPKNTAFRLYRQGNTLRAIFCGNSSAAHSASRAAPGCDYPVLIGNDPHYGGLGGEFAITTSSRTSGTMVLRHELGHNFGRVGEEYDGGGYFGANHTSDSDDPDWKHWLSATPRAEPSKALFLDWPWHHLQKGPYEVQFTSDGTAASTHITISLSGFAAPGEIEVTLDGQPLALTSPGHADRAFHTWFQNQGLPAGNHKLRFVEKNADGDNWVSNLTVHEYKSDFVFDEEAIGAYPMFGRWGGVDGYRSNWETCLMRHMESVRFCSVCVENIWILFLQQISLIDDVTASRANGTLTAKLKTLALGALRPEPAPGETLRVRWFKNNQPLAQFDDQHEISLPAADARDKYKVEVTLETPEVRKDTGGVLKDSKSFGF